MERCNEKEANHGTDHEETNNVKQAPKNVKRVLQIVKRREKYFAADHADKR